jgi:hypothetical protein
VISSKADNYRRLSEDCMRKSREATDTLERLWITASGFTSTPEAKLQLVMERAHMYATQAQVYATLANSEATENFLS